MYRAYFLAIGYFIIFLFLINANLQAEVCVYDYGLDKEVCMNKKQEKKFVETDYGDPIDYGDSYDEGSEG